jgi:hypothetical protein
MAQPVKVIGPPYDELVVDTGHLEGVQRILDDLKIEYVGCSATGSWPRRAAIWTRTSARTAMWTSSRPCPTGEGRRAHPLRRRRASSTCVTSLLVSPPRPRPE